MNEKTFRTRVLECSAAENMNINEIFKSFLILSKIDLGPNFVYRGSPDETGGIQLIPILNKNGANQSKGLRRNLSAYGRLKSQRNKTAVHVDFQNENCHYQINENGHVQIGRTVSVCTRNFFEK